VFRTIAKIAFNYFTHVCQTDKEEFVFDSRFSDLRQFILDDKGVSQDFVRLYEGVMVEEEKLLRSYRIVNGHIIELHCEHWDRKLALVAKLRFFNDQAFKVKLCNLLLELPIRSGHLFVRNSGKIIELTPVN
jgi:hypothetical protein